MRAERSLRPFTAGTKPMVVLVTGSSGHLGEALMRRLRADGRMARGIDLKPGPFTDLTGSIADRVFVARAMAGADAVIHPATLHKPHVATHARRDFSIPTSPAR